MKNEQKIIAQIPWSRRENGVGCYLKTIREQQQNFWTKREAVDSVAMALSQNRCRVVFIQEQIDNVKKNRKEVIAKLDTSFLDDEIENLLSQVAKLCRFHAALHREQCAYIDDEKALYEIFRDIETTRGTSPRFKSNRDIRSVSCEKRFV